LKSHPSGSSAIQMEIIGPNKGVLAMKWTDYAVD
jgi:hypothetical protein